MNVIINLSDGHLQKLTLPCTINSVMLTNHLSFCDDDGQTTMDLQLTAADWSMYVDFVTSVAVLEKDAGVKFRANVEFSKGFFARYTQDELDIFARVERYLICEVLRDSLDLFIGSLFQSLDRDTILKAYGVIETVEEKKMSVNQANRLAHEKLLRKACEIVPELEQYNFTLYD